MDRRIFLFVAVLLASIAPLGAADLDGLAAVTASGTDGVPVPGPAFHTSTPMMVEPPVDPLPQLAAADAPLATPAIPAADSAPTGNPIEGAREPAAPPTPTPAAPDLPPETRAPEAAPVTASPSQNVTINLISLMVKRGLITREDAEGLIQQAIQEAAAARPTPTSPEGETSVAASSPGGAGASDDVAVNYVPDVVKKQIRDDVTADVMKQARDEHWGKDEALPDWVHRFHITGDIRVREQADYFPSGNDNTGAFTAFNTINTGAPFDLSTLTVSSRRFPPEYNVDQDRFRIRLRARIAAGIDLGDNFTAGMRIGTGQDNSPTTQNQTLGVANNGQGGDFSKYAVWLDRAFIRYDLGRPEENFSVTIGRFDNPFLSSSMIWESEIGFDGFAAKGNYQLAKGVTAFATGGVFPVFNTDFNFASNQASKFESDDKWLYALQAGVGWQITKDLSATGAAAIYYFDNVAGRLSDPFTPTSATDQGDTDDTRPSFAQNGNTYRELRDIVPTADNGFGTIDQFQYYGLATEFHDVALTGKIDFSRFDPFHVQLLGEFVDNVAYDSGAINRVAVNNRGEGGGGGFVGGAQGYNVRLTVGQPVLQKLWDWNVTLTYRYVESDCTIDGFTDSDFGGPLAGTNLKGYIVGGYLALSPRITASLRFLSADAIAGAPYHDDVLQFDINAKF